MHSMAFVARAYWPALFLRDPMSCSNVLFVATYSLPWSHTTSFPFVASNPPIRDLGRAGDIYAETEALLASCKVDYDRMYSCSLNTSLFPSFLSSLPFALRLSYVCVVVSDDGKFDEKVESEMKQYENWYGPVFVSRALLIQKLFAE
jgi:hypothetical protein